jgi:hypothetical protein
MRAGSGFASALPGWNEVIGSAVNDPTCRAEVDKRVILAKKVRERGSERDYPLKGESNLEYIPSSTNKIRIPSSLTLLGTLQG